MSLKIYDSDFVGAMADGLSTLATRIALSYDGNWEDMIAMKELVARGEHLEPATARRVLNMTIGSPMMRATWENEIRRVLYGRVPPRIEIVRSRPAAAPRPPSRKIDVSTRARVKCQFGTPSVIQGVTHVIDHRQTHVRWGAVHRAFGGYDFDAQREPTLWLTWMCGKTIHSERGGLGSRIILSDDVPEGRRRCRACQDAST